MKTKILVIAAFLLTFAAGVLTGAIVVREYGRHPPPWARLEHEPGRRPHLHWETLKSQLNLSEAQSRQVAEIIDEHQEKLRRHLGQAHPIIKEMTTQIDSVLTPEQRQKFRKEIPPPFWKMPHRPRKMPHDSLGGRF